MGPTASGKSGLALALAQQFGGELVNADAFARYRGMDIGTAKPTPAERALVRHHCVDDLDIGDAASVAAFQASARAAVADVETRGAVPIVVGGSALYVKALCDDLDIPPRDPAVRAELQAEADRDGAAALHRRLAARDPEAAAAIDPRNVRRVIRALEVVTLTGSFTARLPRRPRPWRDTRWLAIGWTRPDLDARISERVHRMWRQGLLAETRRLRDAGLADSPTARAAVGYAQALAVLAGDLSPDDAIAATIAATRTLARRQERTFRGDARVTWLAPDTAAADAAALAAQWWS